MADDAVPRRYHVVVNAQEQYALWPAERTVPDGWFPEGTSGTEEECLRRVETLWHDIRPLDLRLLPTPPATAGDSLTARG
ncbi:MbtH family protein [Streptomyces sp. NPDC001388]|uniref:MbtH family protein n=1 Tax=unclassified Streptomyces TaxID=2593676 RepID=UPI003679F4CA